MESLQLSDDDEQRPDWASLPPELLRIIASAPQLKGDRAAKRAALASCKAFGRASARSSVRGVVLHIDRREPFLPTVRVWRELWGEEKPDEVLMLMSQRLSSPGRCWSELLGAGERLPFVTALVLRGLSLDVVLPLGVGALLPNLRALSLLVCLLTPAAAASTLDAGCTLLHSLTVEHLVVLPAAGAGAGAPAATQANSSLQQLANLPSLSAVALLDGSCPTLFLAELGTQLTGLHLNGSYRQCLPGTQTPTPAWRATLQHVARCTRLRDLVIPGATAEELHLVAPALQHLRTLCLTQPEPMSGDGDAVIEALLGLPHLTSLDWHVGARLTFSRWRTESPCGWEELMLGCATPEQLARLPLHSLKQPVRWQILVVRRNTPVHEVRAAVANVVERCPEGFRWNGTSEAMPPQLVLWRGKVAPVLRALQPLFAALAAVEVAGVKWDARLVEVLGEVLPRTCTRLALSDGRANEAALEQVARSLPWVQRLELLEELAAPDDVVGFVRLARRLKEQEGGGVVRLEEVVVERPVRPSGMDKEQRMAAWDQAAREVTLPGREGCGGVVLRVVWEEQKQEPFGGL